jgi:GNAT superfamily N-acetyltransferase
VSWFRSSRRRPSEAPPEAELELEASSETAVAVRPREELTAAPLADLHELARDHGVARYRLLRREELIEALGGGAPQAAPAPSEAKAPESEQTERQGPVRITEVRAASVELLDAVQRLVRQLSSSASVPGAADLEEIVSSPATSLLVARSGDDAVVGMLTLAFFRIPTGLRAWIEDVVVDEGARGSGVGEALTREAIRFASERGARTIDLTSRRERETANRMYEKLGFEPRATTVYRTELG